VGSILLLRDSRPTAAHQVTVKSHNRAKKRYFTDLVPALGEQLRRKICGRGWKMAMGIRPDKCCDVYDPRGEEIVIYARDVHRAEATLSLFMDSLELISGPWGMALQVVPEDDVERKEIGRLWAKSCGFTASDFDLAAMIAKKASESRRLGYALALYSVSCHNHVNEPMDIEPGLYPYGGRSEVFRDQVRFAYAIIAAYAVIEQLGLTPEPESFECGMWKPGKRERLEAKLRNAGVDLTDLAVWRLRGGRTRLEIDRPPKIVRVCPWSRFGVRDCEVEVVDAIADLRALRSHVAAHDVKRRAECLSVDDVANAQYIARRLILAAAGFDDASIDKIDAARRYPTGPYSGQARPKDRAAARRAEAARLRSAPVKI
jgi:hypothetical protein